MLTDTTLLKLCAPKCRHELAELAGYEPHPVIFYPEPPYPVLLCERVARFEWP